jgi:hypothetical protein
MTYPTLMTSPTLPAAFAPIIQPTDTGSLQAPGDQGVTETTITATNSAGETSKFSFKAFTAHLEVPASGGLEGPGSSSSFSETTATYFSPHTMPTVSSIEGVSGPAGGGGGSGGGGQPTALPDNNPGAGGAPGIVIGGSTYTPNPSSELVIGGTTLSPGGPTVTVDNTPVAIPPGGSSAVVGGSVVPLALATGSPSQQQGGAAPPLTLPSTTLTPNANNAYPVAPGSTLSVGGSSVKINGQAYALRTNSQGQTELIAGPTQPGPSTTANAAGLVLSALGQAAASQSSVLAQQTGGAGAGVVSSTVTVSGSGVSGPQVTGVGAEQNNGSGKAARADNGVWLGMIVGSAIFVMGLAL